MSSKIHYFDVGARGDLGEPWKKHQKDLCVFGFEADEVERSRLSSLFPDRIYFPVGLFSKNDDIDFYLTRNPYQSSAYVPSPGNTLFEPRHWSNRQVVSKLKIAVSTLDQQITTDTPVDAIKIDTQGCELDILKGSTNTLISQRPILFLETWVHPVYSGAPLMHEILTFLYSHNYELWAAEPAAAWRYSLKDIECDGTRQRLIGLNLMLVPELESLKLLPRDRIIAKANILSWYHYYDAAYILADHLGHHQLMLHIRKKINSQKSIFRKLFRRLKIVLRDGPPST